MTNKYGWHSFGATLRGLYHEKIGRQNDDFYAAKGNDAFTFACVSDGLGSKIHSSFGSKMACLSVCDVISRFNGLSAEGILREVHSRWVRSVSEGGYSLSDCGATCLFAYRKGGIIRAARLGDGFIGICMMNGDVKILTDTKEDLYVNETECLTKNHDPSKWEVACFPEKNVMGVVLCTDGVSVRAECMKDFSRDFCREYTKIDSYSAEIDVNSWLCRRENSARHDDSTVACMLRSMK